MLERLIHQVEARLLALWQGDDRDHRRAALGEEITRLHAERAHLAEERDLIREARQRDEQAVVLLPTLIESSLRRGKPAQALRQALELDRARRELEAERLREEALEQACWSLAFRLRQLRRQLRRLSGQSA